MAGRQLLPRLTRRADGAERFGALLAARWGMPFAWGRHDCCLWAADAVLALTGHDPAAAWRGRYDDAAGAGRLVRRLGGVCAIAQRALGDPIEHPMLARAGDVGVTSSGALVVCIGEWWTVPSARGLGLLPLADALDAWRVG